jgi:hypothetical protein
MTENTDAAAGVAALAICESLLLALAGSKLLSVKELSDALHDAAAAHSNGDPRTHSQAVHAEAVAIIERIMASANAA